MADIVSWKDKAERARATLVRYREESKAASEAVLMQLEVTGGGAIAAVLDHKMQFLPGTNIETKTAVGGLLGLAGMIGPFAKFGPAMDHLANIGAGINAVNAYEATKELLAK